MSADGAGGELMTDRLVLRRWQASDLGPLAAIFAKPEVWTYPFGRGFTREETHEFIARRIADWDQRGWSQWAVVHRGDGCLIGFLGLSPPAFLPEVMPTVEVGWRLDPAYWGRGLATEGGHAALDFGFSDLHLPEIVSICEPENRASERVMLKLGMILERETTHPEHGVPLRVYRMTNEQWTAIGS